MSRDFFDFTNAEHPHRNKNQTVEETEKAIVELADEEMNGVHMRLERVHENSTLYLSRPGVVLTAAVSCPRPSSCLCQTSFFFFFNFCRRSRSSSSRTEQSPMSSSESPSSSNTSSLTSRALAEAHPPIQTMVRTLLLLLPLPTRRPRL